MASARRREDGGGKSNDDVGGEVVRVGKVGEEREPSPISVF